jgi:signal transduction histidine kinase
MCALAVGLGWWVTRNIEEQVVENTATNLALYVQSFLGAELQGLKGRSTLTKQEIDMLHKLLADTPLGKRVLSVKIWKEDGLVVYYSHTGLVGQRFPPTENLERAWRGEVRAEFDALDDLEDSVESAFGVNLLEVYSPVREAGTARVIAVVEFYQGADDLAARLRETRFHTWFVVVAATLAAFGLLLCIVQRGGRTIRVQRDDLSRKIDQLSALLAQNAQLDVRLRRAAQRSASINEQLLRRLSADLHDGPAQLMSLVLLRLDSLTEHHDRVPDDIAGKIEATVDEVRDALLESLTEMRQISQGLSLPELEGMSVRDVLEKVVTNHQQRTNEHVELASDGVESISPISNPLALTLYRIVQEALMNVHRHASGAPTSVYAWFSADEIHVSIKDSGPGFDVATVDAQTTRLGLHGLRGRVEALGGDFYLASSTQTGTAIYASLPLRMDG